MQTDRTIKEQQQIQDLILNYYSKISQNINPEMTKKVIDKNEYTQLQIQSHIDYLIKNIEGQVIRYQAKHYDQAHPWLVYWTIHPLILLNQNIDKYVDQILIMLEYCQQNGFSGSPNQTPHLAPTYASILTIIEIGTEKAYSIIKRENIYKFLMQMKTKHNSFIIHENGEEDIRALYIAVIVAKILNIDTEEFKDGISEYISKCQTYEGGFGSDEYSEAHGGYTYCAYAALLILNDTEKINKSKLLYWLNQRQISDQGGFTGRTNKVIDACYTFWQGAVFKLLQISQKEDLIKCNDISLQIYVLFCCQDRFQGGLRDKPGKPSDLYHTCYALSGLSLSQDNINFQDNYKLQQIDPVYNVEMNKLLQAQQYFQNLKMIQ